MSRCNHTFSEWPAYTLTGSVREEVMFVLHGTGNNGKSTFRETIHSLLGDYALAADAGLLIERKSPGGATPELARLKGASIGLHQ